MFFTLFLSRKLNNQLNHISNLFIHKKIIYDNEYEDDLLKTEGFFGLTKMVKQPSAWDKAFYFLHNNLFLLDSFDYFFFVEDDVYSKNAQALYNFCNSCEQYDQDLISREIYFKKENPYWHWWSRDKSYEQFNNHIRSFNPLCRLSKNLIKDILVYREKHKKFIFHEILFPCLCVDLEMKYLDMDKIKEKEFIGKFVWRPIIDVNFIQDEKIYHPVKPIY